MNIRLSDVALLLVWVTAAAALSLPVKRTLTIRPGTTMGFEFNETTVFEFLAFKGTIDCLSYNFTSTQPMNAAIWFEHLAYIKEYALNYTVPPIGQGVVPNSWCNATTSCGVHFKEGELPGLEPKIRSSFAPLPYTIVFWYDLNNTLSNNVSLVLDTPCYTGEPEILHFPPVPVAGNTIITTSSP